MIVIGPSRILRLGILSIWGAGVLLIAGQHFIWAWVTQLVWTAAIVYWVLSTCGLNSRRVTIEAEKREVGIGMHALPVPVTAIRPGIVTQALVTFELQTADSSFAVIATRDNVTQKGHWQLRRLLLEQS